MDNWEIYYRTHAKGVGKELTGSPPLSFVSNGQPLADYRIYGASGGVGDKTRNLFDEKYPSITTGWDVIYQHIRVGDGNYTLSTTTPPNPPSGSANLFLFGGIATGGADSQKNGVYYGKSRTVESKNGYITIGYRAPQGNDPRNFHTMLRKSSTAATYEPYGYKIPIVCRGTTTNIYLDEPLRKTSKLPTGYTQVEYIRSTGTQYIDTNFIPNQDTRIKVKIMTKDISGMTNKTVFGSRESPNSKHYSVTMGNGSQNLWWTGYGTSNIGTGSHALRDTLYEIEKNKNVTILNGSVLATNEPQTFTCPSNLYLFCMNQGGATFYSNIELYLCKIWDNDVLIRNFIPCKNPSNVIGMYDTVNDVFYSNAGTGSFIAGAEVETVYYTDYIDYAAQKRHNLDGTESSVTLPEISTLAGTNTLTVWTEVQPSNMYIKYGGSNVNQSLMKYLEYKYKVARNKED